MTGEPPPTPPPVTPPPTPPPRMRRRADRGKIYTAAAVVVVAAIVVGAGYTTHWYGLVKSSSTAVCPSDVTLSGAGASFLSALMDQWEISYTAATSNKVNYNPSGAGAGITSFAGKEVQFAATDEPVLPSELPSGTLTLPVTGGAVAIVYYLSSYHHTIELNATDLIGIYSGTITNWDSAALNESGVNPGLPNVPIVPVIRSDAAGTTYVLTNYLSDDSSTWASAHGTSIEPSVWPTGVTAERTAHGNSGMATYVNETAGAIGYVDLADAMSHTNLGIAGVENPSDDYVAPTVANTQSAINDLAGQPIPPASGNWSTVSWVNAPGAGDYPLATLSYFLALQNPGQGYEASLANTTVLVQWLDWVITTGQTYSSGLLYDNPPAALLTQDKQAISTVNYNGASIPTCS